MARKKKKSAAWGGARKGSGRKAMYGKTVMRSVLLPAELDKKLKARAEKEKRSKNSLIVELLNDNV